MIITLNAIVLKDIKLEFLTASTWGVDTVSGLNYLLEYISNKDSGVDMLKLQKKFNSSYIDIETIESEYFNESNPTRQGTRIAYYSLKGVMRTEDTLCTEGVSSLISDMRRDMLDPSVTGAYIDVNSGGGESMAGDLVREAVKEFAAVKPIIAHVTLAASAAYNAISTATAIYGVSNRSEVGSIGTYLSLDMQFIQELKDTMLFIYSDHSVEKNEAIRQLLDKGDTTLLRKEVTKSSEFFMQSVKDNRKNVSEAALKGKVFSFEEDATMSLGLTDGVKTYSQVLKEISNQSIKNNKYMNFTKGLEETFKSISKFFSNEKATVVESTNETTLPTTLDAILERMNGYESSMTALTEQVNTLTDEVSNYKNQLEAANTRITELETLLGTEQENVAALKADNESLRGTNEALQAQITTLENEVADSKMKLERKENSPIITNYDFDEDFDQVFTIK